MLELYDIDIIGILILIVVFVNNVKNSGERTSMGSLFRAIIVCNILLLFFDMLLHILGGRTGSIILVMMNVLQSLFFAGGVLFCFFWALYCRVRAGHKHRGWPLFILCVPLIIFILFLITNSWNHFIFRISAENTYERGKYFLIYGICVGLYVGYSMILIILDRKNLTKKEYHPYLFTPVFIIIVGIIELFFQIEVLLTWTSAVIGILVVQLYVLDEKISIDHLTGLFNRKYVDEYIEDMMQAYSIKQNGKSKKMFAALMLDIDNFKNINDTYGHLEGDNALVAAAELLTASVRKGDFVSRYGGDEFLIILEQCTQNTPERVIRRIDERAAALNKERKMPCDISFSIGYRVFGDLSDLTSKQIFSSIDELMYKDKQSKMKSRPTYSQIRFDV